MTPFSDLSVVVVGQDDGKTIYLSYNGEPIAQQRPRARLVGKKGGSYKVIMYDPNQRAKKMLQTTIREELEMVGENLPVFSGAKIKVAIDFCLTTDNEDLDNMAKLVLVVLNALVYDNDVHVVQVLLRKTTTTANANTKVVIKIDD